MHFPTGNLSNDFCWDPWDTTWVAFCSVFVLGMIPALGMFEAGQLSAKSTVAILTQVFFGAFSLGFLWLLVGYALVFGESHGHFIGDVRTYGAFRNFNPDKCFSSDVPVPVPIHALFQMMFAAITPLLMTGCFAERLLFKPFVWFMLLWEVLIYYPVAHWVWNADGWLAKLGVLDFAGGIVIHTTAGCAGLATCYFIGPRKIFKDNSHPPASNVPLATIGGLFLWLGWFSFNAGSALGVNPSTIVAMINTQGASCAGGLVHMIFQNTFEKVTVLGVLNGAVAGLAAITPAAAYVSLPAAILIGSVSSLVSWFVVELLRHKLRVDDALDVFAVHGMPGIIGSLFIGALATRPAPGTTQADLGFFYGGGGRQFGVQLLAIIVAGAWAVLWTVVILFILQKSYGILSMARFEDESGQMQGLDRVDHGLAAYHGLLATDDDHLAESFDIQRARQLAPDPRVLMRRLRNIVRSPVTPPTSPLLPDAEISMSSSLIPPSVNTATYGSTPVSRGGAHC